MNCIFQDPHYALYRMQVPLMTLVCNAVIKSDQFGICQMNIYLGFANDPPCKQVFTSRKLFCLINNFGIKDLASACCTEMKSVRQCLLTVFSVVLTLPMSVNAADKGKEMESGWAQRVAGHKQ